MPRRNKACTLRIMIAVEFVAKSEPQRADANSGLNSIEEYRPLIGAEAVDRILGKAAKIQDLTIVNVSSTQYGGGVAEILSPLTLLMNPIGIETGWRVTFCSPVCSKTRSA